jgi:hypothetical protein
VDCIQRISTSLEKKNIVMIQAKPEDRANLESAIYVKMEGRVAISAIDFKRRIRS